MKKIADNGLALSGSFWGDAGRFNPSKSTPKKESVLPPEMVNAFMFWEQKFQDTFALTIPKQIKFLDSALVNVSRLIELADQENLPTFVQSCREEKEKMLDAKRALKIAQKRMKKQGK